MVLGAIGGALGSRKDNKSARKAERKTDKSLKKEFGRAENVLRGFLPEVEQRSGVASNALMGVLRGFEEPFDLSPGIRDAIDRESTRAREMSAAHGLSQSGGLQGELEKIRTGMILDDVDRRSSRGVNQLRALSPFATESPGLFRDIENLNLDLAHKLAINRGSRLGSNPKIANNANAFSSAGNALQEIGGEIWGFRNPAPTPS